MTVARRKGLAALKKPGVWAAYLQIACTKYGSTLGRGLACEGVEHWNAESSEVIDVPSCDGEARGIGGCQDEEIA